MKVLITGSAGFIGSALAYFLLDEGYDVVGLDNHNDYYDPLLKEARLKRLLDFHKYIHIRADISDKASLSKIFEKHKPTHVVNLAAQAGVRYSLENPYAYLESNVYGFLNILEESKRHGVEHLVYASSSSVYGANTKKPFSTSDNVDHPLNLYAATKKSNELMAHAYSHLFKLPCTGMRFFTVYGPWGRPDMALFKFARAIMAGEKIQVFNYGKHSRDFTYIDDIVLGIINILPIPPKFDSISFAPTKPNLSNVAPWRIFNIGNGKPVRLMDYIEALENSLKKKASIEFLPLQMGDVSDTHADMKDFSDEFNYSPATSISVGVDRFVHWYTSYYDHT